MFLTTLKLFQRFKAFKENDKINKIVLGAQIINMLGIPPQSFQLLKITDGAIWSRTGLYDGVKPPPLLCLPNLEKPQQAAISLFAANMYVLIHTLPDWIWCPQTGFPSLNLVPRLNSVPAWVIYTTMLGNVNGICNISCRWAPWNQQAREISKREKAFKKPSSTLSVARKAV